MTRGSPQSVEHGAVGMQADHAVLHCHAVQKGLLVVKEVGVRKPQLVGHTVIQSQVQVELAVRQPLVPPTLLEIHGDGVVLGRERRTSCYREFTKTGAMFTRAAENRNLTRALEKSLSQNKPNNKL